MKKILLFFVVVLLITPVMGESGTLSYYHEDIDTQTYTGYQTGNSAAQTLSVLKTGDIQGVINAKTIVTSFAGSTLYLPSAQLDDEILSADTDVTFKIGSTTIGTGNYHWFRCTNDGITSDFILTITFDEQLVVGSLTGPQLITMLAAESDVFLTHYKKASLTPNSNDYLILTLSSGSFTSVYKHWTYFDNSLNQQINYDYNTDTKLMNLDIIRGGLSNEVTLIDSNDITRYTNHDNSDESISLPQIETLTVKVLNPFTSVYWEDTIPETSTSIPDEQTALIHNYVSDAVTRHLIGNGHTTTVTYDGNEEAPFTSTWPGGESHTTIDLTYGSSANLTISAVGYEDSQTYHFVFSSVDTTGIWLRAGTKPVNYVYLQPIATPSNTTAYATFEVQEQLSGEQYFYSSGAAVTVGSTTLITSGLGSCSFELEAGTYPYTVKKTGFQTVSGSFSLGASNQYISVKLPKIQTAPTPTDPTGQPGVDYPYSSIDPRSQAEESIGIIFQSLPAWASLCVIVVTISFIGWMSPRKGKR